MVGVLTYLICITNAYVSSYYVREVVAVPYYTLVSVVTCYVRGRCFSILNHDQLWGLTMLMLFNGSMDTMNPINIHHINKIKEFCVMNTLVF